MKTLKSVDSQKQSNEKGFAAIVIAMVLVLVLSLLTVGFAELMRKETRSALDKQLSSQAYYAAESGINDAAAVISHNPTIAKKDCGPTSGPSGPDNLFPSNKVGPSTGTGSTGASYPCLLIDPTPPTLEYTVSTGQSKVTELQGVDSAGNAASIGSIMISWEDTDRDPKFVPAGTNCNGAEKDTFLPVTSDGSAAWSSVSHTGLLRTQLIPVKLLSRDELTANTYTAFMCPQKGDGTSTSSDYHANVGANSGAIVSGNCSSTPPSTSPRFCNVKIENLGDLDESTFFLNLRSIYSATNVTVTVYGLEPTATQLNIAHAQILIDSTGKAQDVLKRIQARIPAHNNYAEPDYGAQAMGNICKQINVMPASVGASNRGAHGTDCDPNPAP